jgi:hypothetical protein
MGCFRSDRSCTAGKKSKGLAMKKAKYLFVIAGLGLSLCAITKAKEIQFTTLPEVVRTTVIHKYNIVSSEKVVRVVEEPDNIYELTIVTDTGNQIVYVQADGTIVERPGGVVESREGTESREGSESAEVTITLDQVRSAGERYEFVQDQGPDAIYIDHQTNKRVIIRGAAGQGPRGGVRTREENKTDIRENERNRTEEENRSGVRTEDKDRQSGSVREKTEEGSTTEGNKNMRDEQKTQHDKGRLEQKDQENRETPGNGQEQKNRDASGNARSDEKNADQRNMKEKQSDKEQRETTRTPGEQQSQEKTKGESKGKAKPSPSS